MYYQTRYSCKDCGDTFWLWKNVDYEISCKKCGTLMKKELFEVTNIEDEDAFKKLTVNFPVMISAYGVWSPNDKKQVNLKLISENEQKTFVENEQNRLKNINP